MTGAAPGWLVVKPTVEPVAAVIDIRVVAVLTAPHPRPVGRAPICWPSRRLTRQRTEQKPLLVAVITPRHPEAVGIRRMLVRRMRTAVGGVYPTGPGLTGADCFCIAFLLLDRVRRI